MTAYEKVVKARGQMLNVCPFWATISLMLTIHEDATIQTMATDGRKMIFNPAFVERLTMEELQGVCAHEAAHVVFEHMLRRNERDPLGWNIAGDFAINGIIKESFRLPVGALIDSKFDGMTVEQIYDALPKDGDGSGKGKTKKGGAGGESDPGGCGEVRDFEEGDEGGEDGEGDGKGKPKKSGGRKDSREQLRRDIKIAITQAAQIQKGYGSVPAGLETIIESVKEPKVNWKELLRRFVTNAAKNDYTWRRPNRRLVSQDVYVPSLHSDDEVGGIVVAIDTSGSCWNEEIMREFCEELNGIVGVVRGDVRILYCDTDIQKEVVFSETDRPIKLEAIGGGGTDFCPVFQHVDALPKAPTCLIYLTDLEGRFPDQPPAYPVMWGLVGYYRGTDAQAPFGEVVPIAEPRRGW